jgi:hypothetical protein
MRGLSTATIAEGGTRVVGGCLLRVLAAPEARACLRECSKPAPRLYHNKPYIAATSGRMRGKTWITRKQA